MITVTDTNIDLTKYILELDSINKKEAHKATEYYLVSDFLTRFYRLNKKNKFNPESLEKGNFYVTYIPYYKNFFVTRDDSFNKLALYSYKVRLNNKNGIIAKALQELELDEFLKKSINYINKNFLIGAKKKIAEISNELIQNNKTRFPTEILTKVEEVNLKYKAPKSFKENSYYLDGALFGKEYVDNVKEQMNENKKMNIFEHYYSSYDHSLIYKNILSDSQVPFEASRYSSNFSVIIAAQIKLLNRKVYFNVTNSIHNLKTRYNEEINKVKSDSITTIDYYIVDIVNLLRKESLVNEIYSDLYEEIK